MKPVINKSKCTGCGACVNICPMTLFELENSKSKVKPNAEKDCIGCKACEVNCPANAIIVKEEEIKTKKKKTIPKKKAKK